MELVNVCYAMGMYTDWNLPENKEKLVDAVRNNKSSDDAIRKRFKTKGLI